MKIENDFLENNDGGLQIIFAIHVGTDSDGLNIYHLLFSNDADSAWGEDWEVKPSILCRNLTPSEDSYDKILEVKTELTLDLASKCSCFSMQDARDKVVALISENLEDAEEYPENGRIVIHFGDSIESVEKIFGKRDIITIEI